MALELSKLVIGIESAFSSGLDGADVDTVVESIREILNQTMVIKDIDKKIG